MQQPRAAALPTAVSAVLFHAGPVPAAKRRCCLQLSSAVMRTVRFCSVFSLPPRRRRFFVSRDSSAHPRENRRAPSLIPGTSCEPLLPFLSSRQRSLTSSKVDVKRERLFRSCFEKKSRDRQAAERNAAKAALRAAKANKATRATEHGSVPEQPVVIATPVSEEDAEAIALADAEDGAAADDDE